MSREIVAAILRDYHGPRPALPVLLILADHANEQGIAWPSVATIAMRCQLKERQVRHHLSALAAGGHLRLIGSRAGGRALSARWEVIVNPAAQLTLSADKLGSPLQGLVAETRQSHALNPAVHCSKPGSALPPKQLRTCQEPIPMHSRTSERRPTAPVLHVDRAFDRFWDAYPKKKAKADAIKAWRRLNPDEMLAQYIVAQVNVAARTLDWQKDGGQFIPHPATYLNARRFDDELAIASIEQTLKVAL